LLVSGYVGIKIDQLLNMSVSLITKPMYMYFRKRAKTQVEGPEVEVFPAEGCIETRLRTGFGTLASLVTQPKNIETCLRGLRINGGRLNDRS